MYTFKEQALTILENKGLTEEIKELIEDYDDFINEFIDNFIDNVIESIDYFPYDDDEEEEEEDLIEYYLDFEIDNTLAIKFKSILEEIREKKAQNCNLFSCCSYSYKIKY
jgi:hypothetical protein